METTLICFSPTHTTRKTLEAVAQGIGGETVVYDLTLPAGRGQFMGNVPTFGSEDLVLLGCPVYGGHMPPPLKMLLSGVNGGGAKAAVVCLYGNRHYDEAVAELYDLAKAQGFVPIGAGAFVGEHSFSHQIAGGRPNAQDLAQARSFGEQLREKALRGGELPREQVPFRPWDGAYLQHHRAHLSQVAGPQVEAGKCTGCGICVSVCPMGVLQIGEDGKARAVGEPCLKCRSCARSCPTQAVDFHQEDFQLTLQNCLDTFAQPLRENEMAI